MRFRLRSEREGGGINRRQGMAMRTCGVSPVTSLECSCVTRGSAGGSIQDDAVRIMAISAYFHHPPGTVCR